MRYLIAGALFLLLTGLGVDLELFSSTVAIQYRSLGEQKDSENTLLTPTINPYEDIHLEAKAVVVLDIQKNEVVFEKNGSSIWPLASLTKLVTASIIEEVRKKVDAKSKVVVLSEEAIKQEGDDGLLVGEQFYVEDLRDMMLVKSSNDAAYALAFWAEAIFSRTEAQKDFIDEMDRFVKNLGLSQTRFFNPTGLDRSDQVAGAYGNAREMAELVSWILKHYPDILFATQYSELEVYSLNGLRHTFPSSAKALLNIPELIGVKTGFTNLAGGNVVFAFNLGPQQQFVISILGSSFEGRFADGLKLYQATKTYIQQ